MTAPSNTFPKLLKLPPELRLNTMEIYLANITSINRIECECEKPWNYSIRHVKPALLGTSHQIHREALPLYKLRLVAVCTTIEDPLTFERKGVKQPIFPAIAGSSDGIAELMARGEALGEEIHRVDRELEDEVIPMAADRLLVTNRALLPKLSLPRRMLVARHAAVIVAIPRSRGGFGTDTPAPWL